MKTPAPHSSAGHSRLRRWILPFSSTCRQNSSTCCRRNSEGRVGGRGVIFTCVPCSTWARRVWPSSSCACSSWAWCRTSSSSSWRLLAASARGEESTPETKKSLRYPPEEQRLTCCWTTRCLWLLILLGFKTNQTFIRTLQQITKTPHPPFNNLNVSDLSSLVQNKSPESFRFLIWFYTISNKHWSLIILN